MNDDEPVYIFEASQKASLALLDVPLIDATSESVKGYGCLVDAPANFDIEIVRWPGQGWRHVDLVTGDKKAF